MLDRSVEASLGDLQGPVNIYIEMTGILRDMIKVQFLGVLLPVASDTMMSKHTMEQKCIFSVL